MMGAEAGRLAHWGQRGTAGAIIAARLVLDEVGHVYPGGVMALEAVSLVVEPGEIVCLLGPSGCGKTTLLRIAAGIERQTSGRILIDGTELAGPGTFIAPEKRGIGLMFQDYALFPHMTILDNVMYGLKALPRGDADIAARRALSRVGLADYAGEYPHLLSGGEQQRVALARAIAPRPGVLLMDEPFSNLDRRMRDDVRDETIAMLREARATTIVVTHDPEEAMRMADRIALMRAGRLVQVGQRRRALPTARRPVRGALLLRDERGRGPRAHRPDRDAGWHGSPQPGIEDGPGRRLHPAAGPAAAAAGHCMPARVIRRLFPRRGRSRRIDHPRRRASTQGAATRPPRLSGRRRGRRSTSSRAKSLFLPRRPHSFGASTGRERRCRCDSASGTRAYGGFRHGWHEHLALGDRRYHRDAAVRARQGFRADGRRRQGHQILQEGPGRR